MKAFISYSHKDAPMLERLHTHLTQLRRDGQLSSWTDEEILAGQQFNQAISRNLESAQLFIALLSPDYIASNYCYEKEFQRALQRAESGELIIVPIILEPCEWQSTPFSQFKALPKDGKAVSTWQNANTAFLDIIQNLRKLLAGTPQDATEAAPPNAFSVQSTPSRNYRVKKDFDSIQKMEFVEKTFAEVKKILGDYMEELLQVDDQIKCRVTKNDANSFEGILVNRNKIGTEATLHMKLPAGDGNSGRSVLDSIYGNSQRIAYSVKAGRSSNDKGFTLSFNDYRMYWILANGYGNNQQQEFGAKEIADIVWAEWLESVGIR